MDSSPIEMLYHAFCEGEGGRGISKEYRRLLDEGAKLYTELAKALNEKQKLVLWSISNNATDREALEAKSCYKDGFIMGFRLAMEMFVTDCTE